MIEFPNLKIEQDDEALIVQSPTPLHTLSSAIVGGGLAQVHTLINRHVKKGYMCDDPAADLQAFAHTRGINGPFVGMMTAVWMHLVRGITVTLAEENLTVSAIVTAGVGNASASGLSLPHPLTPGTINIIVLIDGALVPAAMVNAVITATEAKTAVMYERNIKTSEGFPATGTSTDAVVIACTGRGTPLDYAGPVTVVGSLIGHSVRECFKAALDAD